MAVPNLLFVDTNIWLDFYRARNETGLRLLERVEEISDKLIVTYQLEIEFKKNRQAAILEGMDQLKAPQQISRPGIFSDARATKIMGRHIKEAEKRVRTLRSRLTRVLENPLNDPVYQVCQRIFHKNDDLTITRDNLIRRAIRRRAYRRYLHGCPPRKKNDTSFGDAFNWEWMLHCATQKKTGLVIVSRDADYGVTVDDKTSYINDHLRQEFSERVSRKRKLRLYSRLSDALKLFSIAVTAQEEEAEKELVSAANLPASSIVGLDEVDPGFITLYRKYFSVPPRSDDQEMARAALSQVLNFAKPDAKREGSE